MPPHPHPLPNLFAAHVGGSSGGASSAATSAAASAASISAASPAAALLAASSASASPATARVDCPVHPPPCSCIPWNHHAFAAPQDNADPSRIVPGVNFRTSMLHGKCHCLRCRHRWMGIYTPGLGWCDGEGMERVWRFLAALGSLIKVCSTGTWQDLTSQAVFAHNLEKQRGAHTLCVAQLRAAVERVPICVEEASAAWSVVLATPELAAQCTGQPPLPIVAAWTLRRQQYACSPPPPFESSPERAALAAAFEARARVDEASTLVASAAALRALHPAARAAITDPANLKLMKRQPSSDKQLTQRRAVKLEEARNALAALDAQLMGQQQPGQRWWQQLEGGAGAATLLEYFDNNATAGASLFADVRFREGMSDLGELIALRALHDLDLTRLADSSKKRHALIATRASVKKRIGDRLRDLRELQQSCSGALRAIVLPVPGADTEAIELAIAFPGLEGDAGAAAAARRGVVTAAELKAMDTFARMRAAGEQVGIVVSDLVRVLHFWIGRQARMQERLEAALADARRLSAAVTASASIAPVSIVEHTSSGGSLGDDDIPAATTPNSYASAPISRSSGSVLSATTTAPFLLDNPDFVPTRSMYEGGGPNHRADSPRLPELTGRYRIDVAAAAAAYGPQRALHVVAGLAHAAHVGAVFAAHMREETNDAIHAAYHVLTQPPESCVGYSRTYYEPAAALLVQLSRELDSSLWVPKPALPSAAVAATIWQPAPAQPRTTGPAAASGTYSEVISVAEQAIRPPDLIVPSVAGEAPAAADSASSASSSASPSSSSSSPSYPPTSFASAAISPASFSVHADAFAAAAVAGGSSSSSSSSCDFDVEMVDNASLFSSATRLPVSSPADIPVPLTALVPTALSDLCGDGGDECVGGDGDEEYEDEAFSGQFLGQISRFVEVDGDAGEDADDDEMSL